MKEQIGHGNFLPWIEKEFDMSERTARRFMEVSRVYGDGNRPPWPIWKASLSMSLPPRIPAGSPRADRGDDRRWRGRQRRHGQGSPPQAGRSGESEGAGSCDA
ncbi:DUF3102 domain-containing protein [Hoeflea ulvae]|uniref:DUF3102 domain-containing protein n=1 Tax=Hoeflea ulvae TaxID=2983764 RepID=UPI003CCC97D5